MARRGPAGYGRGNTLGARSVTLLQLAVLAVVQGVTEFLPISSSGHLVLVPAVAGWPDQGLVIDVAVHVGTLAAVVVCLWPEIRAMLGGLGPGGAPPGRRLLVHAVLASVPVMAAGALVFALAGSLLRSPAVIAWATLGFGLLLYVADRFFAADRRLAGLTWGGALLIGLAQVLALVPGASRAGVTITAARFLGLDRADAARFSMLLAIPAISAAGAAAVWRLHESGAVRLAEDALVAGVISFATAVVAIRLMLRWLARASFTPFVVYRVLLGAGLLCWLYL